MKATALLALATMVTLASHSASAARVGSSPESAIRSGIYSDSTCSDPGFLWVYVPDPTHERAIMYHYAEHIREALREAHIEIPFPHMHIVKD